MRRIPCNQVGAARVLVARAAQSAPARGRIVKKVLDGQRGAAAARHGLRRAQKRAVAEGRAHRVLGALDRRRHGQMGDVAERGERLAAEAERAEVGEASEVAELGGGVALAEEREVLGLEEEFLRWRRRKKWTGEREE